MTYELDGEQYVSVLSGWGNVSMMIYGAALEKPVTPEPGRIVTFKLVVSRAAFSTRLFSRRITEGAPCRRR